MCEPLLIRRCRGKTTPVLALAHLSWLVFSLPLDCRNPANTTYASIYVFGLVRVSVYLSLALSLSFSAIHKVYSASCWRARISIPFYPPWALFTSREMEGRTRGGSTLKCASRLNAIYSSRLVAFRQNGPIHLRSDTLIYSTQSIMHGLTRRHRYPPGLALHQIHCPNARKHSKVCQNVHNLQTFPTRPEDPFIVQMWEASSSKRHLSFF